ncbi:MAG TPA: hypothetical protein V6D08_03595 [Candidatus Obscuribacterales bacterium]
MAQNEIKISIELAPDEDLSLRYESSVAKWLKEKDPDRSAYVYVEETFPLGCMRMRAARPDVEQLDLLFVPVGTQPFAPIMAIVGNPARCVALLETPESRPFGLQVEQAFAGDQETVFLHVKIDPTDTIDIGAKMKAVFDTRGLPPGTLVGADITGGRKPTTAAIAGAGSVFGWRLFYVEATFERDKQGLGHHETLVELPNVIDVFGVRKREIVLALLEAGAFDRGIKQLEEFVEESAASRADRHLLTLAKAAAELRQGHLEKACSLLKQAASTDQELMGTAISRELADLERHLRNPHLEAAALLIAARALHKEGNDPAAKFLLYSASSIIQHHWEDKSVPALLRELNGMEALQAYVTQLAPIDKIIGRGWAAQLRTLHP